MRARLCLYSLLFGIFFTACATEEADEATSALTSNRLPDGIRPRPRDIAATGMISPLAEPVKWTGGDSGLLFAELSGSTYSFCYNLNHPGHDMNVAWTSGNDDDGTTVYAAADGIVVDIRRSGTAEWGAIEIEHVRDGRPFYTNYGHNGRIFVALGELVRLGEPISEIGRIGTTYSHLHFEARTERHGCHQPTVDRYCMQDYIRDSRGERETLRSSMFFGCDSLRNRNTVLSWYANPIETVVASSMDSFAAGSVGLEVLGDSVLPSQPAFTAAPDGRANPSSATRRDLEWCRRSSTGQPLGNLNCLYREYRPSVWGGRSGYLVHPINHGGHRPYWVRSAIGERWMSIMRGTNPESCGIPISGEYLNCPGGTSPCRSVRQDFQYCYITWQEGRTPEVQVSSYTDNISPGAFENRWAFRTPRGASRDDSRGYMYDDSGYLFADAYSRNGLSVRLGRPYGPVHRLGDTRYYGQSFTGGENGRALIIFDPDNALVSSDIGPAYEAIFSDPKRMSVAYDSSGTARTVVYGDIVRAAVIRTGFLEWYEAHDGIRRLGAPLDDEYQWPLNADYRPAASANARQDFESGNCLMWVWDRPSVGYAYCGEIRGLECVNYASNRDSCPFVGIPIDGGTRGSVPLDLPPSTGSGPETGGGGDPDAGAPSLPLDAGMLFVPPDASPSALPDSDGDGWDDTRDCYPRNPDAYPGGAEVCDNVDNDCTGITDDGIPDRITSNICGTVVERCFSGTWIRISGGDPVPEVCNEYDDDCDGLIDEGGVCTPVCVPTVEICDNRDQNCDGIIDNGIPDRFTTNACGSVSERCSYGAWVRVSGRDPVAETCNNLDDDCDRAVDEGLNRSCSTSCGSGTETCSAGVWQTCTAPSPRTETCNGVDDDCDGTIDEGVCALPPPPADPFAVRIRLSDAFLASNPCTGGWEIQLWLGPTPTVSPRGGELETTFTRTSGWSSITLWCASRTPAWPSESAWSGSSVWSFAELSWGGEDLRPTTNLCIDPAAPASGLRPIIMWEAARQGSCPP